MTRSCETCQNITHCMCNWNYCRSCQGGKNYKEKR